MVRQGGTLLSREQFQRLFPANSVRTAACFGEPVASRGRGRSVARSEFSDVARTASGVSLEALRSGQGVTAERETDVPYVR